MRRLLPVILSGLIGVSVALLNWLPVAPLVSLQAARAQYEQVLIERLQAGVRQAVLSAGKADMSLALDDPFTTLRQRVRTFGLIDYVVWDRAGDVRATNRTLAKGAAPQSWDKHTVRRGEQRLATFGIRWRADAAQRLGWLLTAANAALGLAVFAVAGLSAWWGRQRTLKRVTALQWQVERLGVQGQAETSLNLPGRDAVAALAKAIEQFVQSSQRRLREQQVRHERLEQALQHSGVALWDWHIETDALVLAGAAQELLDQSGAGAERPGKTPLPGLFQSWLQLLEPADRQAFQDALNAHIEYDAPLQVRGRIARGTEAGRWFEARGQVIRRSDEQPVRVLGTLIDIEAWHASMAALEQRLAEREAILDALDQAILALDRQGRVTYLNALAIDLSGWQPKAAQGTSVREIYRAVHGNENQLVNLPVERVLNTLQDERADGPFLLRARHGDQRMVAHRLAPLRNRQGQVIGLLLAFREVTESRTARTPVGREQTQVMSTLRSMNDAVVITDNATRIVHMNAGAEQLSGWGLEQVRGAPFAEFFPLADADGLQWLEGVASGDLAALRGGSREPATLRNRWGATRSVDYGIDPMRREDGTTGGAVVVLRDVSERVEQFRQLEQQAQLDPLTGLGNRAWLTAQVERQLAAAGLNPAWYAWLEVLPEPTAWHACGQLAWTALWRRVADQLRAHLGRADAAARLEAGGFALLLQGRDEAKAQRIVTKLCSNLESLTVDCGEQAFSVILYSDLLELRGGRFKDLQAVQQTLEQRRQAALATPAEQVEAAEEAAAQEAEQSVTRVELPPHLHADWQRAESLRAALSEGRLLLFGRAIVALTESLQAAGIQVSLRLKDARRQVFLPGELIAAAERCGMMVDIDRWVIRSAIETLSLAVEDSEQRLPVAPFFVQVATQTLAEPDFVDYIRDCLQEFGLAAQNLCVAVPEQLLLSDGAKVANVMRALQEVGCLLCVDRFGRGLASSDQLHSLGLHSVMFEQILIRQATDNSLAAGLLAQAQQLAQALQVPTIAPGVASEASLQSVREMGIQYAQGDYLGMPRPLYEVCFAED